MQHIHEDVVDQPSVGVIEHILEHQTDNDPRGDDRQIKAHAENTLSASEIVDQIREQHSAQQDKRNGHKRVKEVVPIGIPEPGAAGQDLFEILKTDKRNVSLHDLIIGQRNADRKQQRIEHEHRHQDQPRQDKRQRREPAAHALADCAGPPGP